MSTLDNAKFVAEAGVEALFENPEIMAKYDRDLLAQNIRMATLKKLIVEDTDLLSEEEFFDCLAASKKPELV